MINITACNGVPNSPDIKEYLLSSVDEIDKLPRDGVRGQQEFGDETGINDPCAIGSTAMVATGSSTEVYILSSENEWIKM